MKLKKIIITIACCVATFLVFSKDASYSYTATIDSVENRFYKIKLTPLLRCIANNNLSDLRIFDAKKNQIPYILAATKKSPIDHFIAFNAIIENNTKLTRVEINNDAKKIISSITFLIANADARKKCKIEGSDDNKNWFVIAEYMELILVGNNGNGFNYFQLNFPSIDYLKIKITIDDSFSSPLNIKTVGQFKSGFAPAVELQKLDDFKLTYFQNAKNKTTEIKVSAPFAHEINSVKFQITEPKLYNRTVSIYKNVERRIRKKTSIERVELANFRLSSNNSNNMHQLNLNENSFTIEIQNQDNLPLTISTIDFFQEPKYITAELKEDNTYTITAGDKTLETPLYDLNYFANSINDSQTILNVKNEIVKDNSSKIENKNLPFYQQKTFLWISIFIASLVLIYFSITLLRQTKDTEN